MPELCIDGSRCDRRLQAALIGMRFIENMHAVRPKQHQCQHKTLQNEIRADGPHEMGQWHMRLCHAAGHHQGITNRWKQKGDLQGQQQANRNPYGIFNPHQQRRRQNRDDNKNNFKGIQHQRGHRDQQKDQA